MRNKKLPIPTLIKALTRLEESMCIFEYLCVAFIQCWDFWRKDSQKKTHTQFSRTLELQYIFILVFFSFEKIDNIDSVRSKNPFIPSILLFHFLICRLALTSSHSLPQFKTLLAIAKYCKKDRIKVPKANINHDVIEKTKLYLWSWNGVRTSHLNTH